MILDVSQCYVRLERVVKLIDGFDFGDERICWTQSCVDIFGLYENLIGDCLVSDGDIDYFDLFLGNWFIYSRFPSKYFKIISQQQQFQELGLFHWSNCNLCDIKSYLICYYKI